LIGGAVMRQILALSAVVLLLGLGVAQAGSGAFLGVVPEPIDEKIAEELGYKGRGVYVASVVEGTAAEKAGMEDGDVIVELDGDKLVGPGHLRDVLGLHSPGDKVKVKVWRDGKTHTLTAELGEHEGVAEKIKKKIVICKEPKAWLGVKLQGLTDQLGAYFGVDKGVLVAEVFDGSPADEAGLAAGDVITRVGDKDVHECCALPKIVGEREPGDKVSVTLVRKGKTLTKEVELAEPPEEYRKKRCMVYAHGIPGMECLGHLKHLGKLKELEALSDIEIEIPDIEIPEIEIDLEELREDMEELKEELQELKKELKEKK
jgi:predicted metalloprotease with PDZ domain